MKKQLDKNIKSLQSDRGGEYLSGDFDKYLLDNGILSQLSALVCLSRMVWLKEET